MAAVGLASMERRRNRNGSKKILPEALEHWIPAFAGMTIIGFGRFTRRRCRRCAAPISGQTFAECFAAMPLAGRATCPVPGWFSGSRYAPCLRPRARGRRRRLVRWIDGAGQSAPSLRCQRLSLTTLQQQAACDHRPEWRRRVACRFLPLTSLTSTSSRPIASLHSVEAFLV